MRLLNTHTFKFSTFFDSNVPEYVILSHRWEGNEITLQQFETEQHERGSRPDDDKSRSRLKVERFCAQASIDGCEWAWVDTCCIDKTSSAELTEAINSMWRWYAEAKACYVYMSDVEPLGSSVEKEETGQGSPPSLGERLKSTAWFTRGWTLQEMLAPRRELFFDAGWDLLGDRDRQPLSKVLESFTGVKKQFFGSISGVRAATVAERMLWVSKRETSRTEDIAYCMLGLFGVYMPLIYGEGLNAFLRLQQEIIRVSDDETIFAWAAPAAKGRKEGRRCGLLAEHPRDFGVLADKQIVRQTWIERPPFSMTHKGLELEIYDTPLIKSSRNATIPINCKITGSGWQGWVLIDLENWDGVTWCRRDTGELAYANRLLMQPTPSDWEPLFAASLPNNMPRGWKNEGGHRRFRIFVRQHGPGQPQEMNS